MENFLTLDEIVLIPSDYNMGPVGNNVNYFLQEKSDITVNTSLPVFTTPIASIIDSGNYRYFQGKGIRPVVPITESLQTRLQTCQEVFTAFSLVEIQNCFLMSEPPMGLNTQFHVLIDTANGHNSNIFKIGTAVKKKLGNRVLLMGGPIGNCKAYKWYSESGFDYVRVGTRSDENRYDRLFNPYYVPMGSLLGQISDFKAHAGIGLREVKIIADGEISTMSDVIKAIACGADYVMIGEDFSRVIEAASQVYQKSVNQNTGEKELTPVDQRKVSGANAKLNGYVRYYYKNKSLEKQALKEGFQSVAEWKAKTSPRQGIAYPDWEIVDVDIDLDGWIGEFKSSVRNAFMMSNSVDWAGFKKNVQIGAYIGAAS